MPNRRSNIDRNINQNENRNTNRNMNRNMNRKMREQELEEALKPFNWGACFFLWIWGLGNGCFKKTFLPWIPVFVALLVFSTVLSFFPDSNNAYVFNIIKYAIFLPLGIVYGQNGNKWAFENRAWWSVDDFKETQKRWGMAVIIVFSFCFLVFLLMFAISKVINVFH